MLFELPPQLERLRQDVRSFLNSNIRPIADSRDRLGPLSKEELQQIIELLSPLRWLHASIPKRFGGDGRSVLERAVLGEEMARVWPALASTIDTHMGVTAAICNQGADWMRTKYLEPALSGSIICCDMVSEPGAGSDTRRFTTRAQLDGDHYVVNGEKMWQTNGPWADVGILSAVVDPDAYRSDPKKGMIRILVDRSVSDWKVRDLPLIGLKAGTTGHMIFKDMRVPARNVLADESHGYSSTLALRGWARVSIAAKAVGIMQAALEDATAFAKERTTFGKPLGAHQLIQGMISEMVVDLHASRLLTYRAAELMDSGASCKVEQAVAKSFTSEAVKRVTDKALQIHGARGLTTDEGYRTERMYRDARIYGIPEGATEILKLIVGRELLGVQAFA